MAVNQPATIIISNVYNTFYIIKLLYHMILFSSIITIVSSNIPSSPATVASFITSSSPFSSSSASASASSSSFPQHPATVAAAAAASTSTKSFAASASPSTSFSIRRSAAPEISFNSDDTWSATLPRDLNTATINIEQANNLATAGSSNSTIAAAAAAAAQHEKQSMRYSVASFDFGHVATPYIISLWIIIVGLAKIGFHVTPKLSSICPESVVLMILGVLIGILLFYGGIDKPSSSNGHGETPSFQQPLTPNLFFLYMLPPIVMDAGYHMPNRLFFDNLMSILMYAVLGTIWNACTIGVCLYLCAQTGMFGVQIPFLDTLLFSSIVSAVDPVAVLAVFEEIHVNEVLYILVFGESLLNDAVTVVLYHMFEGYTEMGAENVLPIDFAAGFASFFVISLGGTLMGVIWGFAAAFVSRFTHHVKIIEPIFVFVMAYLSYLSAEMFHLSGILALTFCGITMKNYVEENITETSQTTLKYAMKMLANSSESVIFLFLGVCTVTDTHDWNTIFVILTIVFALVFRALGVVIFTTIANRFRLHKLTGIEQFIMSYGGLRGAVAFALVLVVNEQVIPTKKMMVTTIIAIVYFTVFLQGMTIGPLVKILKVPRAQKYEMSMNERIHSRLMDHIMAGIEDISGMMIGNYKLRDKFRHFNNSYLKHWFLRDSHERGNSSRKIFETYSRLNLQDAINIVNKQNLLSMYNNNNPNQKTLTSLFRTYTESNFSATSGGNGNVGNTDATTIKDSTGPPGVQVNSTLPTSFTAICIGNEPSNSFNFDLANLGYSPSNRDLAEAEIHHILSDNLFKPVRRYRKYNKCDLPENGHLAQFQHMDRHQVGYLMSQNLKKRRTRKVKTFDTNGQEIDPNGHPSVSPESALTTDTHLAFSESGDVDQGITFSVGSSRNSPRKDHHVTHMHHLTANRHVDCSVDDSPKTAVEAILPWRRNSSFGPTANQENADDNTSMVLKQEEFPPWITNKDYLPNNYASPTNTMLQALDRDRQNSCHKIPHVHEIFQASGGPDDQENSSDRSVGLDLTELNAKKSVTSKVDGKRTNTNKQLTNDTNETTTTTITSPFTRDAPSPAEAVTAINPAFLDDNDIPVTKL